MEGPGGAQKIQEGDAGSRATCGIPRLELGGCYFSMIGVLIKQGNVDTETTF